MTGQHKPESDPPVPNVEQPPQEPAASPADPIPEGTENERDPFPADPVARKKLFDDIRKDVEDTKEAALREAVKRIVPRESGSHVAEAARMALTKSAILDEAAKKIDPSTLGAHAAAEAAKAGLAKSAVFDKASLASIAAEAANQRLPANFLKTDAMLAGSHLPPPEMTRWHYVSLLANGLNPYGMDWPDVRDVCAILEKTGRTTPQAEWNQRESSRK